MVAEIEARNRGRILRFVEISFAVRRTEIGGQTPLELLTGC